MCEDGEKDNFAEAKWWGPWENISDAVIPSSSGNGRPIIFVPLYPCCKNTFHPADNYSSVQKITAHAVWCNHHSTFVETSGLRWEERSTQLSTRGLHVIAHLP